MTIRSWAFMNETISNQVNVCLWMESMNGLWGTCSGYEWNYTANNKGIFVNGCEWEARPGVKLRYKRPSSLKFSIKIYETVNPVII